MLLFAFISLQAAPPPDTAALQSLAACVVEKSKRWATTSEDPTTIVETALGSCAGERQELRRSVAAYVEVKDKDNEPRVRLLTIQKVLDKLESTVKSWSYEAILNTRSK
jgi:hypothetical protein